MTTERRLGVVGIVLAEGQEVAAAVNGLLGEFGAIVLVRTAIPLHDQPASIISVVIDATTDQLGAFTGRLGMVPGVKVKSLML
ncbi:MAG: CopG family transcriptional regulator [Desulfovibrionaceae bacterium]|jgi:putative iron-only hydrogenase system regulator|nr:CopG family transcriptional regulator [Desulfovibrionaceae bacterium]